MRGKLKLLKYILNYNSIVVFMREKILIEKSSDKKNKKRLLKTKTCSENLKQTNDKTKPLYFYLKKIVMTTT